MRIWEAGQRQHPLDRALTILMSAFPGTSRDALALLSVGQRDSCLLAVRERTFGGRLASLARCPSCQEKVEFALNTTEMHIIPGIQPVNTVFSMPIEGGELSFRLPNSLDLAAIVGYHDITAARSLLVRRCVLQATQDGTTVAAETLPESVIAALAARMDECDPLAEININLDCPECGYCWQVLFDIVSFLWTEISTQVKRLVRDVHTLAQAYGWREADILSMSTARRQLYLEMVT